MRADAQSFGLSNSVSPTAVVGTNAISYAFTVTNRSGYLLFDVLVTNTFSAGATLLASTNSQGTNGIDPNSGSFIFNLGTMTNGTSATMGFTVSASGPGLFTNTVVVATTDPGKTNTVTTNLVVLVYNSEADLGVQIVPPVQGVVVTNDLTTYDVLVTNYGPNAAAGVMLTNTLPPGVTLKSSSQSYTVSSNNLIFSVGTLAAGAGEQFQFLIQPTNVATVTFAASVGAPLLLDPNLSNNLASTNVMVIGYLAGTLIAVTNSVQTNDLQTGLCEQSILLTNAGTTGVPAARLVVTGLTKQLFNAVGTNGTSPFVYLNAPLPAGRSVNLLLQYNPRGIFPFTNSQLHAYGVPMPTWTPASVVATSTNLNISRIVKLPNGHMLIEFPSTLGQAYTVVYSDNVMFSNAMIAPPGIIAPANEVQWIDYGPPTTPSEPTNSPARFYRVYKNP